jgi:hypothetical protein
MREIFFWLQSERARDNTTTNLFYFIFGHHSEPSFSFTDLERAWAYWWWTPEAISYQPATA